jgi:hypothetical protein
MMRTLLAFALLAGICVSAFGIANADDRPAPEMSAHDTATWLTFFDKLVSTVVRDSSGTCDKLAGDVGRVIDANQEAVAVARAAHAQGKKLPKTAQEHMVAGVKKMMPGMQKCGQDGKVRAAFARLDLTRPRAAARRRR